MAFLVRCPHCQRPKRIDGLSSTVWGEPDAWCLRCGIWFTAWVDRNGVAMAMELPPFSLVVRRPSTAA